MNSDKSACSSCDKSDCASPPRHPDESTEQFEARMRLAERMAGVRHKVLVLSGKGGVGKSTVAANLALHLALNGHRVGLLDVDIHGPSIPKIMGLEAYRTVMGANGMLPAEVSENLLVMSIGFMLRDPDSALIWRGPMKIGVIQQFLRDTDWGDLDYLVVDCPPGTGDEPLTVAQSLEDADGALIVTTPQDLAISDVRKSITFCRKVSLPVLGVIENMCGFVCPHCGETTEIFGKDGAQAMCQEMKAPYLGGIPIDPRIVTAGDSGEPFAYAQADTPAGKAMARAFAPLLGLDTDSSPEDEEQSTATKTPVVVAVPTTEGQLSPHFGHCECFTLVTVDRQDGEILAMTSVDAPDHQPGLLPGWLAERQVQVVLAGGLGERARELFQEHGIEVVTGVAADEPKAVVQAWLSNRLQTGENVCNH